MDISEIVSTVAGSIVIVVTGFLVASRESLKAGLKTAAEKQAEEAVTRLNWPAMLARELEKVRSTERQELRFESYGALWAAMRPFALYSDEPVNRAWAARLTKDLSDWYFSATGGLLLTSHAREMYFALQGLLRAAARTDADWTAARVDVPETAFKEMRQSRGLPAADALIAALGDEVPADWPGESVGVLAHAWREEILELGHSWSELTPQEQFTLLQQVSSVLRSGLTYDVESRLR